MSGNFTFSGEQSACIWFQDPSVSAVLSESMSSSHRNWKWNWWCVLEFLGRWIEDHGSDGIRCWSRTWQEQWRQSAASSYTTSTARSYFNSGLRSFVSNLFHHFTWTWHLTTGSLNVVCRFSLTSLQLSFYNTERCRENLYSSVCQSLSPASGPNVSLTSAPVFQWCLQRSFIVSFQFFLPLISHRHISL